MIILDFCQEHLGLREVGCDKSTEGEELLDDIVDSILLHQRIAAGRNHHGVIDHRHVDRVL